LGREVTLAGWLYYKRTHGRVWFLIVRDGLNHIQCVVSESEVRDAVFQACGLLERETPISVTGQVNRDERAPGGYEIRICDLTVIRSVKKYPVKESDSVARLFDRRHLTLRFDRQQAIQMVRSQVVQACHTFFCKKGYIYVDPPLLMPAGGPDDKIFDMNYFGQKAFLCRQHPFYMTAAAGALGRVYSIQPVLQKENRISADRLTEFRMVEVCSMHMDLDSVISLAEALVLAVIQAVLKKGTELTALRKDLSPIKNIARPFQKVMLEELAPGPSARIADKKGMEDFTSSELSAMARKYRDPFIIRGLPDPVKRFYLKTAQDGSHSLGFYLILPGPMGKVITGGEYEDNCDTLRDKLRRQHFSADHEKQILELCHYIPPSFAGFRLCIEKMTAWICGLSHIRDASLFPRMRHRLHP